MRDPMRTSERAVQNEIRNALAGRGMFFRANVGSGWTGKVERPTTARSVWVTPGDVVIRDARPFDTGLPNGFSDLFGLVPVSLQGQTIARFVAIECKAPWGRTSPLQTNFLDAVRKAGGLSGVARSVDDALGIVEGRA